MNLQDSSAILCRIGQHVFESLAFMPAARDDDTPPPADELLWLQTRFRGPLQGRLQLGVTPPVATAIAINLLGDVATDGLRDDALLEFLNVLCGNVLPELAGSQAEFSVTDLERISAPSGGAPAGTAHLQIANSDDDGVEHARVLLFVDASAPAKAEAE